MGTGTLGQWGFSAVFAVLALHFGWLAVARRQTFRLRVGRILHLVMALDMVAMMWPAWDRVPVVAQLVVFTGGLVWYVGLGLGARSSDDRHAGAAGLHAVMMAAMVWMVASMGLLGGTAAGHHHGALPRWAALLGVGITAGLVVVGVISLVAATRSRVSTAGAGRTRTGRARVWEAGADAVMGLAMAATCLTMLLAG